MSKPTLPQNLIILSLHDINLPLKGFAFPLDLGPVCDFFGDWLATFL